MHSDPWRSFVAKLCSQCGRSLPREDSRFCNYCGAVASPNASSSPASRRTQVISGERHSAPGTESATARPALREQIAFAPSSSPVAPDDAPPWLGSLDKMGNRSHTSPPARNAPLNASKVENPPSNANAGRPFSPGGSRLPQRELRIKVWEDEDTEPPDFDAPAEQHNGRTAILQNEQREEQSQFSPALSQDRVEEDFEVEDLPTTPMPSTFAPEQDIRQFSPAARNDRQVGVNARPEEEDREDADLPTRPLAIHPRLPEPTQANRPSGRPFPAQAYRQTISPQSSPGQSIDQRQQGFSAQVNPNPGQVPVEQRPVTPALPSSYPGFQQPAPAPAANGIAAGSAPARPVRRKSKMRVVVVLVMLLILLGGGLAYWIIAYQPFSVPAVTQTALSFSNTNLGVALQYPQGWTTQLDSVHQTVSFFNANHVDQVNISVTARNGSSVPTYVNKEVAQLGLTAQKNLSPITFAGTSWQQVQGTVLVSGATYTETLLVALHGNHFYAIVLYAIVQVATPAVTYADADHLFFSMFRASFRFL
jgi:hypothetical protein